MYADTKLGLRLLGAALLMGVLGDALLRATPWGLNAFLWTTALVAAILVVAHRSRSTRIYGTGALLACAALFAAALAWRDSAALKALNGGAVLTALALASFRARKGRLWPSGIGSLTGGVAAAAGQTAFGAPALVAADIGWKEIPRDGWVRHAAGLARGLLIAAPLLLLFGALLVAADAAFQRSVSRTFSIDVNSAALHVAVALACAWLAAGYVRGMLLARLHDPPSGEPAPRPKLGILELATVLGLLDALFVWFVAVQFRHFFGGDALVQSTPNFTCADYARGGFFELTAVAALVLPLLLAAHWALRPEPAMGPRVFAMLASAMVVLVFVIMASAVERMLLYQAGYGLTELRLYTTAFMGWLAVVFVWLCATVLRGRRERFALGALLGAFAAVAVLDAANPDAMVVRANVGRATAGRRFDALYNASLSADAVPQLVRSLVALPAPHRAVVAGGLLARWSPGGTDWRAWNWDRSAAREAVAGHRDELDTAAAAIR